MKKIFENAVWWSGVVMVGLILGISPQFVRAWTEPMEAPPGGNVGAPVNTGANTQWKGVLGDITKMGSLGIWGSLETYGFKMLTGAGAGKVLTSDANGVGSWQAGSGGAPVGVISAFGGTNAPAGYLLCDGNNNISRTTYAALFAVIGTTYGSGSDGGTFKLPDLRQRFPLGKAASGTGATLGESGGSIYHSHSEGVHTHTVSPPGHDYGSGGSEFGALNIWAGEPATTGANVAGSTGSDGSYPPYQTVNYIIKY